MKKITLLIAFYLSLVTMGYGQSAIEYRTSTAIGTYTELTTPTVLGSSTTNGTATSLDDVNYRVAFPGGYSFSYLGTARTDVNINTNGYIGFGTVAWTDSTYGPLGTNPAGGTTSGVISAFGLDLNAFSSATANPGNISWKVEGTGTDEVFVVQYKNFKPYENAATIGRLLNFQIRLYESTHATKPNQIEFVYGNCVIGTSAVSGIDVGIRGATGWAANVNNLMLDNIPTGSTCTWLDPVTANDATNGNYFNTANTAITIPNGLTYTWIPQTGVLPVRTFAAVSSIVTNGANISWTAPTGATQYNVQYKLPGSCVWTNWSGNPVMTNSLTLTGLTAVTTYQIRVQASNGTLNTIWSHIPNSAGTGSGYADTGTFTTLPEPCAGTPLGGTITGATSRNICTGLAPGAITVTGMTASNIPGISYQWEESINSGTSWANAVSGTGATTATYTPPTYAGTPIQYRMKVTCANGSGVAYSNVISVLGVMAPTTQATALTLGNAAPTTFTVSWTIGTGSRRLVYVSTSPITDPVSGAAIPAYTAATAYTSGQQIVFDGTGTSVTVTGLACGTPYYVKVFEYNRCGSGPYDVYFSTVTGTNALTITNPATTVLPITNSFTGFTGSNLGVVVPGWYEAAIATTAGNAPTTANPLGLTSSWTSSSVFTITTAKINLLANTKNEWVVGPKFNVTANARVKFKAAITDTGVATADAVRMAGTDDKVKLMVSSDCGATWTVLQTFDATTTTTLTNALQDFTIAIPATFNGQTIQVAFQATDGPLDDTPDYDFHIGAIVVELTPNCDKPVLTATTNITKNSATINWNIPAAGVPTGYQYVVSTTNTTPTGAGTAVTATTANIGSLLSETSYYIFVRTVCGSDFSDWTVSSTFKTLCPYGDITATTPATRCGAGSVSLAATASSGILKWYEAATGGVAVATGSPFVTSITANKTYYVTSESVGSSTAGGARIAPPAATTAGTTPSEYGLVFNATSAFTLNSVDVFLNTATAGDLVVTLKDNTGTQLQTITVPVPAGSATAPVQFTVNLGWAIPVGTGYRLLAMSGPSMVRESGLGGYPYAVGSVASVTDGYILGTSTAYYFFYNWNYTGICAGPRTAVAATVNAPPTFTLSGNPAAVCTGQTTAAVTITAGAASYDTYAWTPTTGVSGSVAAGWTFNPSVSTTYTLQASQSTGSLCNTSATVNVVVNSLPGAVTISPDPLPVCQGTSAPITAQGAVVNVNAIIGTGTTAPSTTNWPNPFNTWYGGTKTQILFKASELTAQGLIANTNINALAFDFAASVALQCNDLTIKIGNTTVANLTVGFENSTSFSTVYNANFTPTVGTTGFVAFPLTTPFMWTGGDIIVEVIQNAGNGGNGTGTTTRTTATTYDSVYYGAKDNVTPAGAASFAALTMTDFTTGTSTRGTSALRPNIRFSQSVSNAVTWAPATNLFTDAAATIPYSGQNLVTVYTKPTAATTYVATVTNLSGCSVTASVNVTINVVAAPTVPAATQEFCNAGTIADFVATGTAIKWYAAATGGTALAATTALVNGTTYYASQTVGGCESVARIARTAIINVVAAPAIANAAQTFCNAGTVANLLPNDASIKWYAAATGGTALVSTTALVNGTQYFASQTVNGCEGLSRTSVTATINVVAAPAISNDAQVFCNNATVADLLPNGAEIKWYTGTAGGAALASTDALVSGTTYYASQTVDGCEGLLRGMVTVTVLVTPAPVIPQTSQEFCNAATVAELLPNDASIKWYTASTGGLPLASTDALVDGTSYFASLTADGCEGLVRTEVAVTVNVTPAPTGDDEQEFCTSATIADFVVVGNAVIWYDAETGGDILPGNTSLEDGVTYYAAQVIAGCEGLTRLGVTAVIHNVVVDAPADVTTCTEYVLPALTSGAYFTEADGQGIELAAGSVITETTTLYVYAEEGTDVVCSDENSFVVTVANIEAPTGDDTQIITVDVPADATVSDLQTDPVAGTITWYASEADAQAGINPLSGDTVLVEGATYYATQTVGACTSTDVLAVTVDIALGREDFDSKAFTYHPNPVKDILNLSYSSEITSVTVFNLLGQRVIAQQLNATDVKIDMSSLADGAYIVNVTSGATVKTVKVIKKQ